MTHVEREALSMSDRIAVINHNRFDGRIDRQVFQGDTLQIRVTPANAASLLMIGVMLPFWTSLLVRTHAWMILLQRRGTINGWLKDLGVIDTPLRMVNNMTGTILGMLHIMLPFMILPLYASLGQIDLTYLRAASNLGASPIRV